LGAYDERDPRGFEEQPLRFVVWDSTRGNYVMQTIPGEVGHGPQDTLLYASIFSRVFYPEPARGGYGLLMQIENDLFGRPARRWSLLADDIGTYARTPTVTFTADRTRPQVRDELERFDFPTTSTPSSIRLFLNGERSNDINRSSNVSVWPAEATVNAPPLPPTHPTLGDYLDTIAHYTGNGVRVEIFTDVRRQITHVVRIQTDLYEVTLVSPAAREVRLANKSWREMRLFDRNNIISASGNEEFYNVVSGLSIGDHVLVTSGWHRNERVIADVQIPETVTGRVTANALNGGRSAVASVTVGGTVYSIADRRSAVGQIAALDQGPAWPGRRDAVLTLDRYGFVVDIDNVGVNESDLMFVIEYFSGLHDGRLTTMLRGILVDGTVVNGRVAAGATYPAAFPPVVANNNVRQILHYRFANNIYTLNQAQQSTPALVAPPIATASSFVELEVGSSIASGAVRLVGSGADRNNVHGYTNVFARDVRFIYIHGVNNTVTVREGVQRVPNITANSFAVIEDRGGVPVVVAVFLNNTSPVGAIDRTRLIFVPTTIREAGNVWVGDDLLERWPGWINAESVGNVVVDQMESSELDIWFYTFSVNTRDGFDVHTLEFHEGRGTSAAPGRGTVGQVVGSSIMVNPIPGANPALFRGDDFRITSDTRIVDTRSPAAQDTRPVTLSARGFQVAVEDDGYTVHIGYIFDDSVGGTGNASIVYITNVTG
jgi:hypothetical protein